VAPMARSEIASESWFTTRWIDDARRRQSILCARGAKGQSPLLAQTRHKASFPLDVLRHAEHLAVSACAMMPLMRSDPRQRLYHGVRQPIPDSNKLNRGC
jgi:hypothetical protein